MKIGKTRRVSPVEKVENVKKDGKKYFEDYFSSMNREQNNENDNSSKNGEDKQINGLKQEQTDLEKIKLQMEGKNLGHISKLISKLQQKNEKELIIDLKEVAIRTKKLEEEKQTSQREDER